MDMVIFIVVVVLIIYAVSSSSKEKQRTQATLRQKNIKNASLSNTIKCPKCLSTQVSANKRGITITTGLIGSQDVYITCLQCGHRWKAGK